MTDTTTPTVDGPQPLVELLSKSWSLVLVRGLAAIAFGIMAFSWPGLTIVILIAMWGAYAAVDGAFSIAAAIKGGSLVPRWWLVVSGLLGIAAAVICFAHPALTGMLLVMIIGWWSIIRGGFEIVGALTLGREVQGKIWLILSGLVSIVFGIWLLNNPGTGALAMIWLIASFALVFGVVLVVLSLRLRKISKESAPQA